MKTRARILLVLFIFSFFSCARAKTDARAATVSQAKTRIASMAPSCTTILASLGLADSLVAVDTWSASVPGVPKDAVQFDMMKPDVERLITLAPDLLFVSTITQEGTSRDPFAPLSNAGTKVIYMPTGKNLEDIRKDIAQVAGITGKADAGKKIINDMDRDIEKIAEVGKTIPKEKRRTVFFEISAAPYIYSFGQGVYLDELLKAAGAVNALEKETGWISVSGEAVLAANPDVILTNVSYIPDPVAEICARPGWSSVKAVQEKRVYLIDANSSSQPGPNVAKALEEIAKAVYPEYFK
jgi:iron complex transport system substrate-binding protein